MNAHMKTAKETITKQLFFNKKSKKSLKGFFFFNSFPNRKKFLNYELACMFQDHPPFS